MTVNATHPFTGKSVIVNTTTGVVRDAITNEIVNMTYDPVSDEFVTPNRGRVSASLAKPTGGQGTMSKAQQIGAMVATPPVLGGTLPVTTPPKPTMPPEPAIVFPDDEGLVESPAGPLEDEIEKPPKPTSSLPSGWTWEWDEGLDQWVPTEGEATNDLFADFELTLKQFNLTGMEDLLAQALQEGWNESKFYLELRKHPVYLANPLFSANLEREERGGGFADEATVLAYAESIRAAARSFGYQAPSDSYIAMSIAAGGPTAKSVAELEHKFGIQQRIDMFGEPVRQYVEEDLGINLSDEDLYEAFDPELPDAEWVRALKLAEYRGRPILLGFEGRSAEDARAYEMLGLDPDEVFARFGTARETQFRTERLAMIEGDVLANMNPDMLREILKGHEDLVVQADVLQLPAARQKLQELLIREAARWKASSGAVATQGGQQIGLLTGAEREGFS